MCELGECICMYMCIYVLEYVCVCVCVYKEKVKGE